MEVDYKAEEERQNWSRQHSEEIKKDPCCDVDWLSLEGNHL
jgi:hypothetical protein